MLDLAVPSYGGCRLPCAGCAGCVDYAGLGALVAGNNILYLIIKSLKIVLDNIINLGGPVLSRFKNY